MNKNLADIKDSAEGVRKVLTEIYDSVILMTGYFISMMILDYKTTLIVGAFIILSITISNTLKKLIYKSTSEYKKTFSKSKDLYTSFVDTPKLGLTNTKILSLNGFRGVISSPTPSQRAVPPLMQ